MKVNRCFNNIFQYVTYVLMCAKQNGDQLKPRKKENENNSYLNNVTF